MPNKTDLQISTYLTKVADPMCSCYGLHFWDNILDFFNQSREILKKVDRWNLGIAKYFAKSFKDDLLY